MDTSLDRASIGGDGDESCTHDVQYGGMCAICGKDMTKEEYDFDQADPGRAQIAMVHDNVSLTVSKTEAEKVEEEDKRRLIKAKKLSLVVDLDQTVIQATVDSTVGEWQQDETNPNHGAVKDVRSFQLEDDGPGSRSLWYYVKLRAGLEDFLEHISELYELHIYTMGTRAYAQKIADIIDPDRKIFGHRILSRDESGSMVAKDLQRLFPIDTKMVVIIDDRADVWNWSGNLLKVRPFDFFVGIGDINASFLPKQDVITAAKPADPAQAPPSPDQSSSDEQPPNPNENSPTSTEMPPSPPSTPPVEVSPIEQLVSMVNGNDVELLRDQAHRHDESLEAQAVEKPLLQRQLKLEAEENKAAVLGTPVELASAGIEEPERPRHHLLEDNDQDLIHIEHSLVEIHRKFYETYQAAIAGPASNRLAELRGDSIVKRRKSQIEKLDLDAVPDVQVVMKAAKQKILAGCTICFSHVITLDRDVQSHDLSLWAKSFGAVIEKDLSRRTTHLVAGRPNTEKVRNAIKSKRVRVVKLDWLLESIVQWKRLPESQYGLVDVKHSPVILEPEFHDEFSDSDVVDSEAIASAFETDVEGNPLKSASTAKPRIMVDIAETQATESDAEGDIDGPLFSPVNANVNTNADWEAIDDELADFLGSDDGEDAATDDGTASVVSTASRLQDAKSRGRKRARDEDDDGNLSDVSNVSRGVKRVNLAPRSTANSNGTKEDGRDPTPAPDADAEGEDEGDEWDDFENEFEAELEREAAAHSKGHA